MQLHVDIYKHTDGNIFSKFSIINLIIPVIFAAFIILSTVSVSGLKRICPKTTARLAGVILLTAERCPTRDRNSKRISERALLQEGKSSTNCPRVSIYFLT